MKLINNIVELENYLFDARKEGKKIGLVPTMGALHEGHASLVKRCSEENDITVVSVFLNPTQFNDPGDLERYPRTLDADCKLCEEMGATVVFAPSVKEMYPTPDNRHFEFPPVSTVMEGAKRPGHFNGVCQVVSRLFYIVRPECAIIRDEDGLAKSSRNSLLAPDERAIAPMIFKALNESVAYGKNHTLEETRVKVVADINAVDGLEVEYFSIVDGNTLQDVSTWEDSNYIVGCITVYCGKTPIRLIDHIKYKED